jgi:hypothetical protein
VADITSIDIVTLGVRLLFAALLYAVVAAVLLALRQSLAAEGGGAARRGPPARRAALTLLKAPAGDGPAGRVIPLTNGLTIGRRTPCEVVLRDDAVSARHARFISYGAEWEVEDLQSTNGTYLNGQRLDGATPLQPGDVVTVGTAALRFDLDGS